MPKMLITPKIYAVEIKRSNYDFIRALNERKDVITEKKKTYFIFEVTNSGIIIATESMSQREMLDKYDIAGHTPFMLGLRAAK
jgi:hypothetical protein